MSIRRSCILFVSILAVVYPTAGVRAQCIIANPSFEISGSGGSVFRGWYQFGNVGSTTSNVPHGAVAARLTGPNLGGWDVSGYWQSFDTMPGEQWVASVRGWHTSTNPLSGSSKAILNIEWRDSGGGLIKFESHDVVVPSTPYDAVQVFSIVSGPAPTDAVQARLLLGVLQGPSDPVPVVYYDLADFTSLGPPSVDAVQWNDFPDGRTVNFSARTWHVKGTGYYGPGPNWFDHTADAVWVDGNGKLHLTVRKVNSTWYSSEVVLDDALGYGDYIFTTEGRLDQLDDNVILGMFLWQYPQCFDEANGWWNPYNEIDVEFSRWGDSNNDLGQFVAQPYDWGGNINRFDATFSDGEITSHAFRWLPDRVEFRSWRGGPNDESPANMIHEWTYTGPHIPRPEQPRVHVNLWQIGAPSTDQEVVLADFTFVPDGSATGVGDVARMTKRYLSNARPNPFNPTTTIAYEVPASGHADIIVYDVQGRRIRTLVSNVVTAGVHEVVWDGRDDRGNLVASGLYLYRLRSGSIVETKKMVLLK